MLKYEDKTIIRKQYYYKIVGIRNAFAHADGDTKGTIAASATYSVCAPAGNACGSVKHILWACSLTTGTV